MAMAEKNTQSVVRKDDAELASRIKDTLVPHVDICEDKDAVTLYADLPGVDKEGLDVHIDKDTLQLYGRRAGGMDAKTGDSYTEMPARDYYRAFTIGEEVDREHIAANLNNGVLKVVLPKSERAKPKKIAIQYA
jgi:HSP20 family molecular chaperone IbpA